MEGERGGTDAPNRRGTRAWRDRDALRRLHDRLDAPVLEEETTPAWHAAVHALLGLLLLLLAGSLWRDSLDPRFSWIGDEYAFFDRALTIATGEDPSPPLLSANGVYDHAPILDSFFQAQVMRAVGIDVAGWKAANIVVVVVSALLVYAVGRELFASPTAGLLAAWFFGLNHYVFAFAHIGYNNLHALPPLLAAAFFVARFLRTGSPRDLFLCGLASGFSFYTFLAARLSLVLAVPVALLQPRRVRNLAWLAAGVAIPFVPFAVANGREVVHQMMRVSIGHSDFSGPNVRVLALWIAGLFLPGFTGNEHHTVGPILTAVPAAALLTGLLVLWRWRRRLVEGPRSALLLTWLVGLPALIILPHWGGVVPLTRLHVAIPGLALVGGLGLSRLIPSRGVVLLAVAAFAANASFVFYVRTPRTIGLEPRALLVTLATDNPSLRTCALSAEDEEGYFSASSVTFLAQTYRLGNLVALDRNSPASALDACHLVVTLDETKLGHGLAAPDAGSRVRSLETVTDRSGHTRLFVLR